MPLVILSPAALRDLQRLREFLREKSPDAARRSAKVIIKALQILSLQPGIGRPAQDLGPDFRELPIDFGATGYLALYRQRGGDVVILAIRHQLKDDYKWRVS
jgi:plasmid stabilization system protein ParE